MRIAHALLLALLAALLGCNADPGVEEGFLGFSSQSNDSESSSETSPVSTSVNYSWDFTNAGDYSVASDLTLSSGQVSNSLIGVTEAGGTGTGVVAGNSGLELGSAGGCDGSATNCVYLDRSNAPQASSLVAVWGMENDWTDRLGSYDAAVFSGTPGFATTGTKIGGYSGEFAAGTDIVNAGDITELNSTTKFTIAGWFKKDVIVQAGGLFGKIQNGFNMIRARHWSNGVTYLYIYNGGTSYGTFTTGTYFTAGQWHHFAMVYDGTLAGNSNRLKAYVDGAQVSLGFVGTIPASVPDLSGADFHISENFNIATAGLPWDGMIDELAVWNTTLTQAEIQGIVDMQEKRFGGRFESTITDAGASSTWTTLSWSTALPYAKHLSGSAGSESSTNYASLVGSTGSTSDNNNMIGLSAHFAFEATAANGGGSDFADLSSNSNVVEVNNGVAINFARSGVLGNAVYTDGTDDEVNVGTLGDFGSNVGSSTISFWYRSRDRSGTNGAILRKSDVGTINVYGIEINRNLGAGCTIQNNQNGDIFFGLYDASGDQFGRYVTYDIQDGKWHHIVWRIVDASTNSMEVYINGESQTLNGSCDQSPSNFTNWTTDLTFGAYNFVGTRFTHLEMELDETSFWTRALHPTEIKQLYLRGANNIQANIRTCNDAACDTEAFTGSGTARNSISGANSCSTLLSTGFCNFSGGATVSTNSETFTLSNFPGITVNDNQYAQYVFTLTSDDPAGTPSLPVAGTPRFSTNAYTSGSVETIVGPTLSTLTSLSESATCTLSYQVSTDRSTWYYVSSGSWSVASSSSDVSTASAITSAASSLSLVSGDTLYIKAFLPSSSCVVSSISVNGAR